ncbi:MAG: hypothetical protein IJR15_06270 [Clostridiales bacterium]|nr:hypothetical protein [Clostridiales bacterium]
MICPRCKTENGNRTVCSKCGYYMYRVANQNIEKRTSAQRALDDSKIVGKNVWKVLRVVWIGIVMLVLSFWIIALIVYLTGGSVILG